MCSGVWSSKESIGRKEKKMRKMRNTVINKANTKTERINCDCLHNFLSNGSNFANTILKMVKF